MKHRGAAGNIQKNHIGAQKLPSPARGRRTTIPLRPHVTRRKIRGRLCGREPPFITTATDPKHA